MTPDTSESEQAIETVSVTEPRQALLGFASAERAYEVLRQTDKLMLDVSSSKEREAEFRVAHSQAQADVEPLEQAVTTATVQTLPDTPEVTDHIAAVTDSDGFEHAYQDVPDDEWTIGLVPLAQLVPTKGIITAAIDEAVPTWDTAPGEALEAALPLAPSDEYFLRDFITDRGFGFEFVSRSSNLRLAAEETAVVEAPAPTQARVVIDVVADPAFVTVARVDGRLLLTNGHHRAYQQYNAGATHIPAIVRDRTSDAVEPLVQANEGLLTQETVLDDRPPVIPDFASAAAITVEGQLTNKLITVRAEETDVVR